MSHEWAREGARKTSFDSNWKRKIASWASVLWLCSDFNGRRGQRVVGPLIAQRERS